MKWSPQQDEALKAVDNWIKNGTKPFFYLGGYAGTGKTTLAKHLADGRQALFGAFTGKAAQVLSEKGCPAKTIHQLIYTPKHKSQARLKKLQETLHKRRMAVGEDMREQDPECLRLQKLLADEEENMKRMAFTLNLESDVKDAELVVIDECSMVDNQMGQDLLSFGTKILVLGDPAQLPPVGGEGYFTKHQPDFMLTEIHRQAKESPIIHMATIVREGGQLEVGTYGNCEVWAPATDMLDIARHADQLLCGRNNTRQRANTRMRKLLGRDFPLPIVGDRMVCLKNNHDKGLLNGQLWVAAEDVTDWDEDIYMLTAYPETNEAAVQTFDVWNREPQWYEAKDNQQFDYGYCLTCHKAQGSQWDNVMVMDESHVFRQDANRWLYTAITRAAETLNVVRLR